MKNSGPMARIFLFLPFIKKFRAEVFFAGITKQ